MKLTMFNPNGAWIAVAAVLSASQDGRRGPLAFDPLRRARIRGRPPGPDASPRTWLGRLRLERLQLIVPAQGATTVLDVAFTPSIAPLACVLDDPTAETRAVTDYEASQLAIVATSIERAVTLSQGTAWASWVDRAVVYPIAGPVLRPPVGAPAGGGRVVTVAEVFAMFGMVAPDAASSLQVDVDGSVVAGARAVPWWDPTLTAPAAPPAPRVQRPMPGLFRLAIDAGAAPQRCYRLIAERSPQWADSLRRYQAAVVDATAARLDVQGLPEPGSPAVGLAAAPLPPELTWYLEDTGWVFTPGSSIFETELRGVAGGVSRWAPASIQIGTSGAKLTCASSQAAPADPDAITYDYSAAGDKQWSGDFVVAPDPDDLLLTLRTLSVDGRAVANAIWLLTETGAFYLPVDRPAPTTVDDDDTAQRLLRGVFHLAEVPWRAPENATGAGPLAPDFQAASLTRLMLTDAGQIEAAFAFTGDGNALSCTSIHAVLRDPRLRLEDFVPPYVPPLAFRAGAQSGPPPLPQAGAPAGAAPGFLGLSFVRDRRPVSAGAENAWRVHLRFRPGRMSQASALEGDWRDTSLEVRLSPVNAARALYWFRPAGLRWIPSLPLYGDPRLDPDHRLCAERTYLPLRPSAGEPITLGLGDDWPVSVLQHGSFSAPVAAGPPIDGPPAFTWVAPELPGMALALMPGEPLAVESGRPAGGRVRWLIRHGLPIQDELFALRALKEPGKPGSPAPAPLDGPDWWRALTLLSSLAQSQREVLADAPIAFTPGAVVAVTDQPVELHNLYAGQTFAGTASLRAIPPRASVDLALPGGGRRSLIAAERLLEGASARFTVNAGDPASSPVLSPSADPAAPILLRAGCLVPQAVDIGTQRMFFDQIGRVSFALPDVPGRGRLTRVPAAVATGASAAASPVITCFQWSHPGLDLSSATVVLGLYFVGLPLERRGASWVFDAASAGEQDPVLRDFRWGTVGQCRLWGLRFQVMRLERVEALADAAPEPGPPTRIVLAGVLHFIDAEIRSADDATQGVRVTLRRDADRWQVEAVDGRFLWPLFEATPDLADATRSRLTDPLPWLEGKVSLVADGARQALALGTPDQPSRLVFQFLDRTWSLPVELAAGKLTSPLDGVDLAWRIVAAAAPPEALAALDGQVTLRRPGPAPSSSSTGTVRFRIAIPLDNSQSHVLARLVLALQIAPDGPGVTLDQLSLLSLGDRNALVTVDGQQAGQVDITARQVSLALARSPGYRRGSAVFELLPGWPVAAEAALEAYLSLSFAPPTAELVTLSVGVEEFQLLLETTLAPSAPAPPRLQVLLVAAMRPSAAQQVSIQLTGQLHAANQITWSAPGGDTLRHTAVFTLRQATLPGERLVATSARAFFAPRAMTTDEDPSGLAGTIELPVLASHRLVASGTGGEREVAAWVAPQRLRLGAPASFIEEVLLRGSKQVDLRIPGLPRVTDGLLALYRFDDGAGTTVHDRSGAAPPLDLAITGRDAVQWTATALTVRSPALVASPQAATGLVDALRATSEVTFEAWLKTPEPNRRDPASLFTIARDHDDGMLSIQLRWDQDHGRPANYYRVTLQTNSDGGRDSLRTVTLDSPAGALTAALSHLVFTRDASGTAILYVDGVERARKLLPGRFSSWDRQARFALANALKNNEPWLGELRLVAIYQRALSAAEVRRNFQALARPTSPVLAENGFAGPLGDALAGALRTTDTMIVEASEAFWLRFQAGAAATGAAGRNQAVLWRDGQWTLTGLPTAESDFFPPDTATVHDWLRLPLPLLTDTVGVISQSQDLRGALQCALPDPAQPPPQVEGQPLVSRESLLHRAMLDQYSLRHRPPHPGYGDPVDQVLLGPDAWERLLPYTQLLAGFAPGWLVFADWPARSRTDGVAGLLPFAAAGEALGRLASPGRPPGSWLAATEAVPDVVAAELPWQQLIGPDGRPRPYLLASPLVAIQQAIAQEPVPAAQQVELRILLEVWVPASGGGASSAGVQPVLAARSVFRIAVAPDDDWTTVLFTGPAGGRPESPLRARVRGWVTQASATLFSTLTPLLRATALTISALPPKAYFLLPRQSPAGGQRPIKRGVFGSRGQLRPDLRFEALSDPLAFDPLGLGPDYLGGQVYYERRTWFEPPAPVLDNPPLGAAPAIDSLTVEPAVSDPGQPVTFRWTTHGNALSLRLGVKDQDDAIDVTGQISRTLAPQRTGVYVLRALSGPKQVDAREVAVVVRVPAAGSAVGLAYKLAGTAAGPAHPSRLPWSDPGANHHRWVEALRDLMFLDLTRADRASHDEPGRFLPSTRRLDWGSEPDRRALRPFLPTRAVQLFTSGRPGGFLRVRTALLDEDARGMLRRSASLAHELRHPRPVPLPPELFPFDPAQPVDPDHPAPRRTCGVAPLPGPAPFRFARLTWQDPMFNRRLLAVGQEVTGNKLALGFDRAIYAGVDVLYPEIRFIPEAPGWSLTLTISLHRKDPAGPYKLGDVTYQATDAAVTKISGLQSRGELRGIRRAATPGGVRRWVWELGLNQPAVLESPGADNDNFEIPPQNYDEVRVAVRVLGPSGNELQRLQITGTVRTDIEVWPQPQNAFGILRTGPGRSGATAPQTDLVAFGWLPKPRVIKRGDRFNPDSWAGTFTHTDARVSAADTPATYEVLSFTADGEQSMPDDSDSDVH